MNRAPSVSVIVPVYNAAAYIAESVESILAQTFTDFELIVVNDGSPDTAELERALRPYHSRMIYIAQENRGAAEARNAAIRIARGEFIAFLDADDIWLPPHLFEQIAFLRKEPSYDLVYADGIIFGDSDLAGQRFMKLAPSSGDVTFETLVTARCNILTSTVVAKRKAIVDVGMFTPPLRRGQDFDLWLRMVRAGARLGYQKIVLMRRREHSQNLSGDLVNRAERELNVMEQFAQRWTLTKAEQAVIDPVIDALRGNLYRERAKRFLAVGNFEEAAEALRKAQAVDATVKWHVAALVMRTTPTLLQRMLSLRTQFRSVVGRRRHKRWT